MAYPVSTRTAAPPRRAGRRRGSITPLLVVALPMLIAAFVLATELALLREHQLEVQISADAAALAGANALLPVDDTQLFGADPIPNANRDAIFANVRAVAVDYAQRNQVAGQDVNLDPNPTNDPTGELVLGSMNDPFSSMFDTTVTYRWNLYSPTPVPTPPPAGPLGVSYNTVRVALGRQGVGVISRAFVDRDVIGFKVQGTSHHDSKSPLIALTATAADPAIPVAPLAIRAESADNPGPDADSWDDQVIRRNGTDTNGDLIPEITVTISGDAADNGQVADVGAGGSLATAIGQISTGITHSQLTAYDPVNKQLTLATGASNEATLTRLTPGVADYGTLASALNDPPAMGGIQGLRRVWLLHDSATTGPNEVRVVGFVVARVLSATDTGTSVKVVLQPSMLITTTAVTDAARRTAGPRTIFNPYVARVRLVQ